MKPEDHPVIRALRKSDVLARRFVDYLVEHGRAYTGVPLPAGIEPWPPGSCIEASLDVKRCHGLPRVQGWSVGPKSLITSGRPFWHSWNTSDGRNAVDASLSDAERCHYFGVPGPFSDDDDGFDPLIIGAPKRPRNVVPLDLRPGVLSGMLIRPFSIW